VLKSYDGHQWLLIAAAAPWKAREGHQLLNVVVNGRREMLLMGGRTVSGGRMEYLNDLWLSSDGGAHWSLVLEAAPFAARAWFGATSYGQVVIVTGGATYAPALRLNDVWMSRDTATWTQLSAAAEFSARYGFSFLTLSSSGVREMANLEVTHNVFSQRTHTILMAGSSCEAGCTRFNSSLDGCLTLSGKATLHNIINGQKVTTECCVSQEKCLQRPNNRDVWDTHDFGVTWRLVG